jgi:hypothetical protein
VVFIASPATVVLVIFPASVLPLYEPTEDANPASVDTCISYPDAFAAAAQLRLNELHAAPEAETVAGADGVAITFTVPVTGAAAGHVTPDTFCGVTDTV